MVFSTGRSGWRKEDLKLLENLILRYDSHEVKARAEELVSEREDSSSGSGCDQSSVGSCVNNGSDVDSAVSDGACA